MRKCKKIISLLALGFLIFATFSMPAVADANSSTVPTVSYCTHIQNKGWEQTYKTNGQTSGTTGKSFRLEAIKIKLNLPVGQYSDSGISYLTHIQNKGWEKNYTSNNKVSGTSGKSLRLEAIKIKLTGSIANEYDVYYRVHAQNFGWLGWAKNGASAGTAGYSDRLEAIEIKIVKKGNAAPGDTRYSFKQKGQPYQSGLSYCTHVQNVGWQDYVKSGSTAGTTGRSLRLEAIKINVNSNISGGVCYNTHIQNVGWQCPNLDYSDTTGIPTCAQSKLSNSNQKTSWICNNNISGTSGQSKRIEAIQVKLYGELANKYDIYYRVHVQNLGWMGWAKNGEKAGSVGSSYRIESIQLKLVSKGQSGQTSSGRAFISSDYIGDVTYQTCIQNSSWQTEVIASNASGSVNNSNRIEAFKINYSKNDTTDYSGSIAYSAHIQNIGWTGYTSNGSVLGNTGSGLRVEAIKLKLTGELSKYCDIWYRTYVEKYGWLGWAKNNQAAGTSGISYRMQAIQIKITPKNGNGPGSNSNYFKTTKYFYINPNKPMVALTFDDGPGARTNELLSQLEKYSAHATFFVVGTQAANYSGVLNRMLNIGCEIGNHTYNHTILSSTTAAVIKNQISSTNNIVRSATGKNPTVMRPPGGGCNATVQSNVGLPIIMWSVDTRDWATRNTQATINSVLSNVKDGSIILMHDIHTQTIDAALQLIPMLKQRGYQLVTVSEMAAARGITLKNGTKYSNFYK